jgi:LacI family transcriptional regulator
LIAIFLPDPSSLYHADLFRYAAVACAKRGYHLLLEQADSESANSALERYQTGLSQTRCDGIILPPPLSNDQRLIECLIDDQMPHVVIAPADADGRSLAVLADERSGVLALFDHLWSLGHRTFGLCTSPPGRPYLYRRNDIFLECLAEKGVPAAEVKIAPFSWRGSGMLCGLAAAQFLLEGQDRPDAIFAFNDEFAHGGMIGAQNGGAGS